MDTLRLVSIISIFCHSKGQSANFQFADDSGLVKIEQGVLQGKVNNKDGLEHESLSFFHVPYAEPPVGELRWRHAQDPKPWGSPSEDVTYLADKNNHLECPQFESDISDRSFRTEDCLFLNIFMPKPSDILNSTLIERPVMVWFYGGAFTLGSSQSDLYDGKNIVDLEKVILVTVNYRLGSFGYLFNDDEEDSSQIPGNQGLSDQIKALEWIQKNIKYFYGNPRKVTIFGQSAGGQSVGNILALKTARHDLYSQAILQSAPFGIPYKSRAAGTEQSNLFLNLLECSNLESVIENWNCARNKSMEQVLQTQYEVAAINAITNTHLSDQFEIWRPVLDGQLLDMQLLNAIYSGRTNKIPIIYGFTSGEGTLFIYMFPTLEDGNALTPIRYRGLINLFFDDENISQKILEQYPAECPKLEPRCDLRDTLSDLFSSYMFDCPTKKAFKYRTLATKAKPTFKYFYGHPFPIGINGSISQAYAACSELACHGSDTTFLFNNFETAALSEANFSPSEGEKKLSKKYLKYFTQFSYTGDPNIWEEDIQNLDENLEMEYWDRYSSSLGLRTLRIATDTDEYIDPKMVDEKCDFWDALDIYLEY